jgi:hypothetical protein
VKPVAHFIRRRVKLSTCQHSPHVTPSGVWMTA